MSKYKDMPQFKSLLQSLMSSERFNSAESHPKFTIAVFWLQAPMMTSAVACIIGNMCYCLSYDTRSFPLLIIARLITGFGELFLCHYSFSFPTVVTDPEALQAQVWMLLLLWSSKFMPCGCLAVLHSFQIIFTAKICLLNNSENCWCVRGSIEKSLILCTVVDSTLYTTGSNPFHAENQLRFSMKRKQNVCSRSGTGEHDIMIKEFMVVCVITANCQSHQTKISIWDWQTILC